MKTYELLIKSYTDMPDIQMDIKAPTKKQAVDYFYMALFGRIKRSTIYRNTWSYYESNEKG